MTSVAMTAGFSSLRRFNDSFKKRFLRPPSALRKTNEDEEEENGIFLTLSYRPPFDFEHLLSFYQGHLISGVERVTDQAYERVFRIKKAVGFLRVTHLKSACKLQIQVVTDDASDLFTVAQRVRQMFDLDSDPLLVSNLFETDPFLSSLWKKYPGLRIARAWDPFESGVTIILGQGVSLGHSRKLVSELVLRFGEKVTNPKTRKTAYLFPKPSVLATADLSCLKTTEIRKTAISEFSKRFLRGEIDLRKPQPDGAAYQSLVQVPGLGPWTAHCISLRAQGNPDIFPANDLILKRAMELTPGLRIEKMSPWKSYVAIYLWKYFYEIIF
jgi:AraC family transcriptional regulator of adaptative response / DNA-3-methyladenine glycosylase II